MSHVTDPALSPDHDPKGFAADLGYPGPPFAWDEERRLYLRRQLDAPYFHPYGLTCDEAGEILDTFPIVRRQDEARYGGKFRTRALILAHHGAYGAGNMDAQVPCLSSDCFLCRRRKICARRPIMTQGAAAVSLAPEGLLSD